jgi:mevalonate kinase
MKQTFYSNGKLLLTSEYLVLDGAKALALPTKFGQDLTIENGANQEIHWISFDYDHDIWFESTFSFQDIKEKVSFENQPEKNTLISILHEAFLLNPIYLNNSDGYLIETQLGFPRKWGLGTSSTLINNIAEWLQIDAFTLLKNSFGGSGYDIACAQNDTAILYQLVDGKPNVEKILFEPKCVSNLYFVYLNQKQSSKAAIDSYNSNSNRSGEVVPYFNRLSQELIEKNDFSSLSELINRHENKMSQVLSLTTVQEHLFPDFEGTIKSLGAWGGDFVLVLSKDKPTAYFKEKGYKTILAYSEMIL